VALDLGALETVPADRAERLEAAAVYDEQIGAGADAGADLIFLQTFWAPSLLVLAAERAAQYGLPIFCAMTFGADGATFGGVTPEAMVHLLAPYHPAAVGLNCSPGPAAAAGVLEAFRRCTDLPLICKPNMPPEHDPEDFARAMGPALELADYAGGCCGTTPEDIAALGRRLGK
jgi:5-methyltetrahydrofolate--homocysteine methyltransferase